MTIEHSFSHLLRTSLLVPGGPFLGDIARNTACCCVKSARKNSFDVFFPVILLPKRTLCCVCTVVDWHSPNTFAMVITVRPAILSAGVNFNVIHPPWNEYRLPESGPTRAGYHRQLRAGECSHVSCPYVVFGLFRNQQYYY